MVYDNFGWREKLNLVFYRSIYSEFSSIRGINRLKRFLNGFALSRYEQVEGRPLVEFNWDNAIILDACRHDLYEEVNGPTRYRYSAGPATPRYIEQNFYEKRGDIVYVSGHPRLTDGRLEKNIGTSDICHERILEDSLRPEELLPSVAEAVERYPEKRKIVHFMQPHVPFIAHDWSENIRDKLKKDGISENDLVAQGVISTQEYWQGYLDNLEHVMKCVEDVLDMMKGRIVITADHANLVGEGGIYGHPFNQHPEPLKKVPLDVRERKARRDDFNHINV